MTDGSINYVTVANASCKGCNDEAMRVVKNMPNWIHSKLNGEVRNIRMAIQIVFMQSVKAIK